MRRRTQTMPGVVPDAGSRRRILRLRGDDGLRAMIRAPEHAGAAGAWVAPWREAVDIGEEVAVEVSFGPQADEIEVSGIVTEIDRGQPGQAPNVHIHVRDSDEPRMRYIREVVIDKRVPTARRYRRVPAFFDVRWWWGMRTHAETAQGISQGGTFIRGRAAPKPGFKTEIEIRTDSRQIPIRVPAEVRWSGIAEGSSGFGVRFMPDDAQVVERLRVFVRQCQDALDTEVVSFGARR